MAESPKKRGLELQWQMLIGFLVGLVGGLIVYRPSAAPLGSRPSRPM